MDGAAAEAVGDEAAGVAKLLAGGADHTHQARVGQGGVALALDAKGKVGYKQWAVASDTAASLSVGRNELVVALSPEHEDQSVTVTTPATWRLAKDTPETVRFVAVTRGFQLVVPKGVKLVTLVK